MWTNSLSGTGSNSESLSLKLDGAVVSGKDVPGFYLATGKAGTLETLKLESTGDAANTVEFILEKGTAATLAAQETLTDQTVAAIAEVDVTGDQDLPIRSDATVLSGMKIDGSGLADNKLSVQANINGGGAATVLNVAKYTDVDSFAVFDSAAGTDGFNVTNVANDSTIQIGSNIAVASTITMKSATGSDDKVTIDLENVDAAGGQITVAGLTVADVENVTITSNNAGTGTNTLTTLTAAAMKSLTVGGESDLNVTMADLAATVTKLDVDASGFQGKFTFDASAVGTNLGTVAVSVTDSAQNDTFTSGINTAAFSFELGNGGDDTVKLAVGDINDSITGFAKGDKIATTTGTKAVDVFTNVLKGLTTANQATIDATADASAAYDAAVTAWNAAVAADATLGTAIATATNGNAVLFEYKGDDYIALAAGTTFAAGTDVVVKVTGSEAITSDTVFDTTCFNLVA